MKVTVRLARSCRKVGGVDGHLKQWVGFAGVLFGNEPSRFVKCLYEEIIVVIIIVIIIMIRAVRVDTEF